jgi:5-(hydroxymethyl)furfural/furfural oxidase
MDEFDYVIVGGGSAGCVLANRLSMPSANRVLLIESGIDTPPKRVPADILETFPKAALNPRYKWMKLLAYPTVLGRNTTGGSPRLVLYDQGRVMGGSSSINFQAANRGAPEDYDEWRALGASGWGWQDVLPYFRKLETDTDFNGPFHGKEGPLPVQRIRRSDWCGFSEATAQACALAGLPFVEDQNSGAFGDSYFSATQTNLPGHRVSAAMAYLGRDMRRRANLRILSESHVREILFEDRCAIGVAVVTKTGNTNFRAKEVILSAGAVHSPTLLMRSGIGPGSHLAALGIPVISDLRGVGENLRDHPGIPIVAYLARGMRLPAAARPLQISLRYSSELPGCPQGDMYASVFSKASWHAVGRRLGMIMTWVNKAYSTGRVSLRSTDWREEPTVELNLCQDARDRERLISGMRFIASLFDYEPLRQATRDPFCAPFSERARKAMAVNVTNSALMAILGALLDGPSMVRGALMRHVITEGPDLRALLKNPAALDEFVMATTMGIKHLSCTCRMGSDEDPMAVTRSDGTVRKVGGLRVVDASIMPSLPRANTNLPTTMLAEKIADLMLSKR